MLGWLLEGNARFVDGHPRHDYESQRRRMMLTEGRHPFGVVLGCADSRVPPELIFDFGPGDLFVIRVAGNVVASGEAGSIEYAIAERESRPDEERAMVVGAVYELDAGGVRMLDD